MEPESAQMCMLGVSSEIALTPDMRRSEGTDSDLEMDGADVIPTRIENLVFRGGGVKGIAYCGAIKVLCELNLLEGVKRYAGSSAGAITAALLAIGYTNKELEDIFFQLDLTQFKDKGGSLLDKAQNLYRKFSLYEGNFFYEWIGTIIGKKADTNITFKQVLDQFGKELVIVGTCLSHMEVVYFNHRENPDMTVRDALRISMSIPILFEPVRVGDHVYVDGGLADNFPLYVFDHEADVLNARHATINKKTLGFFLQENKMRNEKTRNISKMQDFIECLVDTVKMRIAMLAIKPGDEERTIFIQTHHISSTRFNIKREEMELLYDEGLKSARQFVSKFTPIDAVETIKSPTLTWGRMIVLLKHGIGIVHHPLARKIYCAVTLGTRSRKTASTRMNKSRPKWDEQIVFPVNTEKDVFTIEVFEEYLLSPHLVGSFSAPITDFVGKHCVETTIDTGKGQIVLDVTLSTY